MFQNNSSKNNAFQSVGYRIVNRHTVVSHQLNCSVVNSSCLFEHRADTFVLLIRIFFSLFLGREHDTLCFQCKWFTTIMHCVISSTVLSHLLSFTLKCTASSPLKRESSLCLSSELRNLSSKLKLPVPLMCQMQWQTMCPNPFLSEQFFPSEAVKNSPQWVISDYVLPAEVIRRWMLDFFKVHCIMIQFALWLFS